MRIFLTLLFTCMLLCGNAQKQGREAADSMRTQLQSLKNDTNKVKLLNELTYVTAGFDQERAIEFAQSALSLAEKVKWRKGIVTSQKFLGIILMESGNRKEAGKHFEKAYQLSRELGDKEAQITILYNIGALHQHENRYSEALDLFLKAIKLAESSKNQSLLGKGYYLVAIIFTQQYDFVKARTYAKAAASIYSKEKNFHEEANNLEILGVSYLLEKNFKEAKKPFFRALALFEEIGNEVGKARIYAQLVECYNDEPFIQLDYISKSQAIWNANKATTIYSISNIGNRGIVYLHLYQYDSLMRKMPLSFKIGGQSLLAIAEKDLKEGIELARTAGNSELLLQFSKSYAVLLEEKGEYKQALEILNKSYQLQDSLFSQNTKNKIASLESAREIEARDKQIEINQLALSNERKTRSALIGGTALLLVIGGLLFYQNQNRRRTNTTLLTLNAELDEANKVKTKFFGILSHDLRSPIVNLINFLHLQKEMPDLFSKERQVHHQKELTESAENLLETMEAMLLWSKSQMEHFAPQKKTILVQSLFEFLQKQFNVPGISFQFQNPGQLMVSSDEDYLKTIMYNLSANAVKALANTINPQIIWKARQNGNQVELSVTDNGPGVHQEQLDALYNENAVVGTRHGLGLHLIRDLAKAIDCQVLHQPGLEKGSVFQLIM